jgi:hypothetical protein
MAARSAGLASSIRAAAVNIRNPPPALGHQHRRAADVDRREGAALLH